MSKQNLNALSKAQLIALLEDAQKSSPDAPSAPPAPAVAEMSNDKEDLLQSLLIKALQTGESKNQDTEDTRLTITLVNTSGMALNVEVRDPFNGSTKALNFDRTGASHKVSPRQLRELKADYVNHFELGLLATPDFSDDNPNTILDEAKFVASVPVEDVVDRIAEITSLETLFRLFTFLESRRYGDPVQTKDRAGQTILTLQPKMVDPKETVMLTSVQRRIAELSPIEMRLDS